MKQYSIFCFIAALLPAAFPSSNRLSAQQLVFDCDSVAITYEAFQPLDYVLSIMDVSAIGTAPTAVHWPAPVVAPRRSANGQSFTRKNLGEIFGISYNRGGDLFVSASSSYNTDAWGTINTIVTTNVPQNSGSIYRINNSGIVEFAEAPNTGAGLGNLTYDIWHNLLLATNFHDGKIYAYNATTGGAPVFTFDPNFDGLSYGTPAAGFIKLGQRPWGIAAYGTNANNMVLYYGRWSVDQGRPQTGVHNEIWSVKINAAGTGITGTETLVYSIPYIAGNYSNPPSDLEISTDGVRMLVAERSMYLDGTPNAHSSRVFELTRSNVASSTWTPQPIGKFSIGASSGNNSTGGVDFGEYLLKPGAGKLKDCNAAVWAAADFINFTAGNYVYGLQILPSTGGNVVSSKWIDHDNNLTQADKTQCGDVDYRRCLQCPAVGDDCCRFYEPAFFDSICCKAGIKRIDPACGPIASVQYTVVGGVIQGFTSDCLINNPNGYSGTASGTVTFSGACNLSFIWASLNATSANGNVTVTWVINFANGQQCTLVSQVKNCPHPLIKCDEFKFKQCICTGAALSYVDINVNNQAIPNSPICSLKIVKYDPSNNVQLTYWSAGSVLTPASTPFTAPFNLIPSSGPSLNVLTGGNVNAQLYFPGTSFSGSITVTSYHCNGDSCVKSWRPNTWPPHDPTLVNAAIVKNVKPRYNKIFATGFKIQQRDGMGQIPTIKYVSVGISDQSGAEIIAVTGAELYPEKGPITSKKDPGTVLQAAQASQNAFWEFKEPIHFQPGNSSLVLHVVFANQLPKLVTYTLYDEEGSVVQQSVLEVLNQFAIVNSGEANTLANTANDFLLLSGAPNPAKDFFRVKYSLGSNRDISFQVYDLNGRLMESVEAGQQGIGDHETALEVAHYPSGVYIVRMLSKDGMISAPIKMVVAN